MIPAITSLGVFATFALAAVPTPGLLPTAVVNRLNLKLGTAHGGALDLPKPTIPPSAAAAFVAGPNEFTIQLIVSHDTDITTVHVNNFDSPSPMGGDIPPGNIENGGQRKFILPREYAGNVALNIAGFPADTGDETLIEYSFKNQNGIYTPDIDVSFVDGFTVPVTCLCFNSDDTHAAGCSKDLYALNPCPNDNGRHACKNPRRFDSVQSPTQFFAPCHRFGGAYTYPDDSQANSLNGYRCRDGNVVCCVGNRCSGWEDLPR